MKKEVEYDRIEVQENREREVQGEVNWTGKKWGIPLEKTVQKIY